MRELKTPLPESDVKSLRAGDVVYLSGTVYTARDGAHQRALSEGRFPENIRNGVVFHAGPVVKKTGKRWSVVAVGPTTSSRMDILEPEFLKRFGVRAIIGKGGMGPGVVAALKKHGAVYLSMTGGCAASAAEKVVSVEDVSWLDLGVPEAVWVLRVRRLGPLVVSIDSHGNSLYEAVREKVEKKLSSKIC
jgi:tartrate/fumarate subfamily iron-sulfur-dependent hydro-lyase beta chain